MLNRRLAVYVAAVLVAGCSRREAPRIEPAPERAAVPSVTASAAAPPTASATASARAAPPMDPLRRLALDFMGWQTNDSIALARIRNLKRPELKAGHAEAEQDCNKGDMLGCALAGFFTEWDDQDEATADAFYVKACRGGEMIACARLAKYWPCFFPDEEVLLTHEMICNVSGVVARFLMDQGPDQQTAARAGLSGARAQGMKACEAGIAAGCVALASSYEEKPGDAKKARELYARACDMGHEGGCDLALPVARSLRKTLPEATAWAEECAKKRHALLFAACEGELPRLCWFVGNDYNRGLGTATDRDKAGAYYKRACDAHDTNGCDDLAKLDKAKP